MEREFCTDDMACRFIRGTRQDYGRLLAKLELERAAPISLVPAASGSSLIRRMRRLLQARERSRVRTWHHLAALLLMAALASVPVLASRSSPVHASEMAVMKHDLHTWQVTSWR